MDWPGIYLLLACALTSFGETYGSFEGAETSELYCKCLLPQGNPVNVDVLLRAFGPNGAPGGWIFKDWSEFPEAFTGPEGRTSEFPEAFTGPEGRTSKFPEAFTGPEGRASNMNGILHILDWLKINLDALPGVPEDIRMELKTLPVLPGSFGILQFELIDTGGLPGKQRLPIITEQMGGLSGIQRLPIITEQMGGLSGIQRLPIITEQMGGLPGIQRLPIITEQMGGLPGIQRLPIITEQMVGELKEPEGSPSLTGGILNGIGGTATAVKPIVSGITGLLAHNTLTVKPIVSGITGLLAHNTLSGILGTQILPIITEKIGSFLGIPKDVIMKDLVELLEELEANGTLTGGLSGMLPEIAEELVELLKELEANETLTGSLQGKPKDVILKYLVELLEELEGNETLTGGLLHGIGQTAGEILHGIGGTAKAGGGLHGGGLLHEIGQAAGGVVHGVGDTADGLLNGLGEAAGGSNNPFSEEYSMELVEQQQGNQIEFYEPVQFLCYLDTEIPKAAIAHKNFLPQHFFPYRSVKGIGSPPLPFRSMRSLSLELSSLTRMALGLSFKRDSVSPFDPKARCKTLQAKGIH
ncbi:uncharacterized protein [Engystomops pustulosus]|uniref:uncharacterized protein n=1 Tax=Engystomops pustulosus TaxID=76066 RepID=UPI003AFA78AB